jgi:NADPH:quinone reductase-like Zn-dependent oxidoreductase
MMIAVTVSRPAGPDSIEVLDLPDPVARPGEVLIAVRAATINPVDSSLVKGAVTERISTIAPPPWTPGWDLAGIVAEVGEGVDPTWIGKTVLGFSQWFQSANGAQAGLVALPLENVAAASGRFSAAELTTFGLNGLTAMHLVRAAGDASTVLVTGAAGGVGKFAVELAIDAGRTVIASAAEKDRDELLTTGALFGASVRELVPSGVDAVLNTVPGNPVGLEAVRDGGIYRSVSVLPDAERDIDVARVSVRADAAGLARIVELAESGAITTAVAQTYPVADAADAYRAMLDGSGRRGKLVLLW